MQKASYEDRKIAVYEKVLFLSFFLQAIHIPQTIQLLSHSKEIRENSQTEKLKDS